MDKFLLFKNSDITIKSLKSVDGDGRTSVYKVDSPNCSTNIRYDENEMMYLKIGRRANMHKNIKLNAFDLDTHKKVILGTIKDYIYDQNMGFLLVVDNGKKTGINN